MRVILAVIGALTMTLAFSPIAELFKFGPLHLDDLALVTSAAFAMMILLEWANRRQDHRI
jgi:Ca2+-transporting ATPase